MLFKTRQVRTSSRFQSPLRSAARQRRESVAPILSMAVVQGFLAAALWMAALRSYQAISAHAGDVSLGLKLVMPVAFAVGGFWCLRLCVKNLRFGRELWSMSRRSTPPAERR